VHSATICISRPRDREAAVYGQAGQRCGLMGDAGRYPFGYCRAEGIYFQDTRGDIHEFCACREENTGRAWAQARMARIDRPVDLYFRRPIWIENPLLEVMGVEEQEQRFKFTISSMFHHHETAQLAAPIPQLDPLRLRPTAASPGRDSSGNVLRQLQIPIYSAC
jgi:hypothetical protein